MRALKSPLDITQVIGHSFLVEVIDDQTLATRGGTLHLHHTILYIKGDDFTGLRFES